MNAIYQGKVVQLMRELYSTYVEGAGERMGIILKRWSSGVPRCLSAGDIAEKKPGDGKWRKACLAVTVVFTVFVLFLCNVAVNDPIVRTGALGASLFGHSPQPCQDSKISIPETIANADDEASLHPGSAVCDTIPSAISTEDRILRREGTETLPIGIVQSSSDLERRHLWKVPEDDSRPQNLLAIPVGIKQKDNVNKIIEKFPAENFTVMLFHYDGKVDDWADLPWSGRAIHVMAFNQTKWWFAKRFLHPDIVARYNYLFLWDEDLGVENFHASRYLDIMEDEGLEISQPALAKSSEIHHRLTVKDNHARAHKRIFTYTGRTQCTAESTGPPCTGWVEMMAPVFSKVAWRCSWYLIQNDLVHAWGLDYKLGYCAQGTRSEKVGVIDSEYIVHEGIPSLGGLKKKPAKVPVALEDDAKVGQNGVLPTITAEVDERSEIRTRAREEGNIFSRRWRKAAANDENWFDPYEPVRVGTFEVTPRQQPEKKQ